MVGVDWMAGLPTTEELTALELLAAAQRKERQAKLDTGQVDTVFQVGGRVLLRV